MIGERDQARRLQTYNSRTWNTWHAANTSATVVENQAIGWVVVYFATPFGNAITGHADQRRAIGWRQRG